MYLPEWQHALVLIGELRLGASRVSLIIEVAGTVPEDHLRPSNPIVALANGRISKLGN